MVEGLLADSAKLKDRSAFALGILASYRLLMVTLRQVQHSPIAADLIPRRLLFLVQYR